MDELERKLRELKALAAQTRRQVERRKVQISAEQARRLFDLIDEAHQDIEAVLALAEDREA